MTDDELIEGFESGQLAAAAFGHAEHVRVAWWYLRHADLPEGLCRFTSALRRFAAAQGAADRYHETITVAFVLVIADRLGTTGRDATWEAFAAANADLLSWRPSVLETYYTEETLWSARARRAFVMPDRVIEPARVV
jgi:hypothetical protein